MPPFLIHPRRPCPRSPSAVLPYIACKRVIPIQDASPQFPNVWLGSLAQDDRRRTVRVESSASSFSWDPWERRHFTAIYSPSHPLTLAPSSLTRSSQYQDRAVLLLYYSRSAPQVRHARALVSQYTPCQSPLEHIDLLERIFMGGPTPDALSEDLARSVT